MKTTIKNKTLHNSEIFSRLPKRQNKGFLFCKTLIFISLKGNFFSSFNKNNVSFDR